VNRTAVALIITLALGILAAPRAAEAQSGGRVYQLGILTLGPAGSRPSIWWQPAVTIGDGWRRGPLRAVVG
jgi:hypothetical protein